VAKPEYKGLIGPESLAPAETRVPLATASEYRRWQMRSIRQRGGVVFESDKPVEAFVNHGRWMVHCAWCANAPLTRPDWGLACCMECGAFYPADKVIFPEQTEEITTILCKRARRDQQNWTCESLEALQEENTRNA